MGGNSKGVGRRALVPTNLLGGRHIRQSRLRTSTARRDPLGEFLAR